jgi:ketosteroid isomerase-like protein
MHSARSPLCRSRCRARPSRQPELLQRTAPPDHFATPDIEYVNPPEAVDPGTRRGRAEVNLALRRARQSSPSYRHELHQLFGLGETVVAAVRRHAGRPSSSETQEEAHTWTLRDGKVVRFERGTNLETALEAAGLRG